jgi:CDP-diacylglycerol--glycerol-3-phosphate 3-phosphatidyltransferase
VVVAMTLLIAKYPTVGITLAGLLIISREIIITALREWMAGQGKRNVVKVSNIGKWKTGLQITAIIMLCLFKPTFEFAGFAYGEWGFYLAQLFLYIAAVLTLWSMVIYMKAAIKAMQVS